MTGAPAACYRLQRFPARGVETPCASTRSRRSLCGQGLPTCLRDTTFTTVRERVACYDGTLTYSHAQACKHIHRHLCTHTRARMHLCTHTLTCTGSNRVNVPPDANQAGKPDVVCTPSRFHHTWSTYTNEYHHVIIIINNDNNDIIIIIIIL